jgi:hypothetical protein
MAECPASWNRATKVIADAITQSKRYEGIYGYSVARQIHDALEKEGLLVHELPNANMDV